MTIKIVTDSTADLPAELANELGITIVPLYVCFGKAVYRDRVDISEDDFYKRLLQDSTHPTTTQPTYVGTGFRSANHSLFDRSVVSWDSGYQLSSTGSASKAMGKARQGAKHEDPKGII